MLDKSEYEGKTVVITGAASWMELYAAQELVAAGANAVMCDLNEAVLRSEVEKLNGGENCGGRAIACATDARKFADAEKAAAEAAKLGSDCGHRRLDCGSRIHFPRWRLPRRVSMTGRVRFRRS